MPFRTPAIFRSAGSVTLLLIASVLTVQYAGAWYGLEIAKASKENDLQQHLEDVARLAQIGGQRAAVGFAGIEYDLAAEQDALPGGLTDPLREYLASTRPEWGMVFKELTRQARLNEAILLDLTGAVLYDSGEPGRALTPFELLELDREQFESAHQGQIASTLAYDAESSTLKRVYAPMRDATGRVIAILCLTAGRGYLSEIDILADYLRLISAISTILVILIGWLVYRILERQRIFERQAAHADRLAGLGQLAAGFAHEVRNPLEIISASAEDLESSLRRAGSLPPDAADSCKDILEEVDRLNRLVSQFLQYSKTEGEETERGRTELAASLAATLHLLRRPAERRGIRLETPGAPIDPALAVGMTETSLRQVIVNLVMNAIQATPDGGRVAVAAEIEPREVRLTVCDTGPGVPAALRARIFEPFFTTRPSGSGLGLAISHQLARASGGRLECDAAPGGGACFILTLPRVTR